MTRLASSCETGSFRPRYGCGYRPRRCSPYRPAEPRPRRPARWMMPKPGPGSGRAPRRARPRHPHDAARARDDVQVHPVLGMLARVEGPARGDPVDRDKCAVADQAGVPGLPGVPRRLAQLRGRAASSATVPVTQLQAAAVPMPNPAASSATVSPLRRQAHRHRRHGVDLDRAGQVVPPSALCRGRLL
jgi:hypothetical protein